MATFFDGPAGPLEMLYRGPDGERAPGVPVAAVVCHPHPAYGGTMHNKVVHAVARGLQEAGLHVLRFNYRGVGMSAGRYDEGVGETADIAAAVDWLAARHPGEPLAVAGFSFGARFGMEVGLAHPRVARLVGVGLAVRLLGGERLAGGEKPVLFVHGDRDEYGPVDDVLALARDWNAPAEVCVVSRCGHFFDRRLPEVQAELREGFARPPLTGVRNR